MEWLSLPKKQKEESKKEKIEAEDGTPLEIHGKLSIDGTDIVDQNGAVKTKKLVVK